MGAAARHSEQQVEDGGDVERARGEADTEPMPALAECGACDGDGYTTTFLGPTICGTCKGTGACS